MCPDTVDWRKGPGRLPKEWSDHAWRRVRELVSVPARRADSSKTAIAGCRAYKYDRRELLDGKKALAPLLDLRGDLTVDVLQRDRVNVGELYVIEGHRESLVVHQVEIPGF